MTELLDSMEARLIAEYQVTPEEAESRLRNLGFGAALATVDFLAERIPRPPRAGPKLIWARTVGVRQVSAAISSRAPDGRA